MVDCEKIRENAKNVLVPSSRSMAQAIIAIYRFLRRGRLGDGTMGGWVWFLPDLFIMGELAGEIP